ncbi:MAG: hypothetical protein GWN46_13935, partial [Gammaproteobacteria bacterium]|nr:hypothetical protein [Gammaproteobacteria bacterium]
MSRLWTVAFVLLGANIATAGEAPAQPREVAAAYLAAIEVRDLDAAGVLFAPDSTIFETGGVEGTWQHYREHHLGPEVDGIAKFTIDSKNEPELTSSRDGTLAVITWPIEYTISLKDERVIKSRGTVTFVLARHEATYRIRHLH